MRLWGTQKLFVLKMSGHSMVITARSKKIVKAMRLRMLTVQWFDTSLEDYLKGKKRAFTLLYRRESRA